MAGSDTVRGITFQHAAAIHAVLDALADPATDGLRFEGADDVIDVEALSGDGVLLWARQMKTRQEPGTWSRADLTVLAQRWFGSDRGGDAVFELVTDAQLGRSGLAFLHALDTASADATTAEELLDATGAETIADLSSFRVRSRAGSASALLEHAEARVLRLLPRADATPGAASSRVDRLFREISLCSGERDGAARRRSRGQLAELLGLPLNAFEAGSEWTDEIAARYRQRLGLLLFAEDEVELGLQRFNSIPVALRMVGAPTKPAVDENRVVRLADAIALDRLAVVGPSGCGKSMTARQIARLAATAGLDAVLIQGDDYLPWRLDLAVSDSVEDVLEARPHQTTVEKLLRSGRSLFVFDGMSELSEGALEALSAELRNVRLGGSGARWVATGRDTAVVMRILKQLGPCACFTVSRLDRGDRLSIARTRLGPDAASGVAESTTASIEKALGGEASDPLLFSMALSSAIAGRPIHGRVQLFNDLLDGLVVRNDIAGADLVLGALGFGFARLIADGVRSTDRFQWTELMHLAAEKMEVKLSESVLDRAIAGGLLVRSSPLSPLRPAHDSIADFLAATAVARSLVDPPSPVRTATEQLFEFLAEMTGLPGELGRGIAIENPLLAVRVSVVGASTGDPGSVAKAATELLQLLLDGAQAPAVDLAIASVGDQLAVVLAHAPEELSLEQVRELAGVSEVFTVRFDANPLEVAARAWAQLIHRGLRGRVGQSVSRPRTVEDAVAAIALHEERVSGRVSEFVDAFFPNAARARLREELGPPGLIAVVHPVEDRGGLIGGYLPVDYGHMGQTIQVVRSTDPEACEARSDVLTGRTTADAIVSKHPDTEAWSRVRSAANRIVGWEWL